MSEVMIKSTGILVLNGKNVHGTLECGEANAHFISKKGETVLEFEYAHIRAIKSVRSGGMSSTITVKLADETEHVLMLNTGMKIFNHIYARWPGKPTQISRAEKLHREAELRGEHIKKKSHVGKALVIALFTIIFGALGAWLGNSLVKSADLVNKFGNFRAVAVTSAIAGIIAAIGGWLGFKVAYSRRRHPNRSIGGDIMIYIMLALVACLMAFPLIFAIGSALKPLDELFRFPPTVFPRHPTLDNFSDLVVTLGQSWVPFTRYLTNTVFITLVGTLGHLLIASMAAFVLAKYDFPGGRFFFGVVVTCLMFSGYVTGIPNYVTMSNLHMIDTYWALLLPAFAAPIGLFMMKQFMEGLPTALIEAAHIDGAKEFRIFWSIVMPNVKPAWLTVIIFSVQSLWGNSAATVIFSEAKKTLVYALQQIQAGGIARTGQMAAVTVVVMAVPILIFILSQSQILETMASSGIKD